MAQVGSVAQIVAAGEATPAEVRAIQIKREKEYRQRAQFGSVATLVKQAVSPVHPRREAAMGDLEDWHNEQVKAFLKELVPDADNWLDSDTIPISMARLRKMAVAYANAMLQVVADEERAQKTRIQAIEHINDKIDEAAVKMIAEISPKMATFAALGRSLTADTMNRK